MKINTEKIRSFLNNSGVTVISFCRENKISHYSYHAMMRGGEVDMMTVSKVARAMGVETKDLLIDNDD